MKHDGERLRFPAYLRQLKITDATLERIAERCTTGRSRPIPRSGGRCSRIRTGGLDRYQATQSLASFCICQESASALRPTRFDRSNIFNP
jgi:hypothetical protein